MQLNKLIQEFNIFMSNEEKKMLERLTMPLYFYNLSEHEQFVVEGLIRKSLVIKIGQTNPKVLANDL
jgi:hypothetical protein